MLLNNIIKGDQQSNDEQELLKTPKYNDIMRSEEERVIKSSLTPSGSGYSP